MELNENTVVNAIIGAFAGTISAVGTFFHLMNRVGKMETRGQNTDKRVDDNYSSLSGRIKGVEERMNNDIKRIDDNFKYIRDRIDRVIDDARKQGE